MRFAQGTWKFVLPFLLPLIFIWVNTYVLIFAVLSSLFSVYLLWFFRDPDREVHLDGDTILSAADGKIIYTKVHEDSYDIAVRMSPFDVHIIRTPIEGKITRIEHLRGAHRSVYFAGAEEKNERKLVTIVGEDFSVELLLLTGAFARRIELWLGEGDEVTQGQRIGIIRFGSQTNVRLKTIKPMSVQVDVGDAVFAGVTPLLKVKK